MSFKLFIYYCALCGGWAAFGTWLLVAFTGINSISHPVLRTTLTAGLLGVLLAAAVGGVDALLNAVGWQRLQRVLVCVGIGLAGSLVGGVLGQELYNKRPLLRFLGWVLVGVAIGASIGMYDLIRARGDRQARGVAVRKILNGIGGGTVGGLVGGLIFEALQSFLDLRRFSLALGLVILGGSIGLLIGLAQVILKEAWLRVESGFRPGREMMLSKPETTIGRAESCDLGLFGDSAVDRTHARILMDRNQYFVEDAGSAGGTFLNDVAVQQATPLRNGDVIRVGNSVLRFGERRQQPQRPGRRAPRREQRSLPGNPGQE
ncbi:MAG: FHA domain-containing protein [Planctomycetes bacterium]|nr:FHA domain-containing protein [Planctomycetota bacterium]